MRLFLILPTLVFALALTCCNAQSVGVVSVATLQAELQRKGAVQLVDVRTHIEGAKHIDWFSDDFKAEVSKLDKDGPVRLYCAGGGRSEEARELLRGMGFKDVLDLDGGISAWKEAGAPVVK